MLVGCNLCNTRHRKFICFYATTSKYIFIFIMLNKYKEKSRKSTLFFCKILILQWTLHYTLYLSIIFMIGMKMTQQKYSQAYAITPWKLVISYCEKLYACRSNIIIMCIIQERPLCVRMVSLFLWSYPFPWAPSVWFHMEKKVIYKHTLRSFFVGRRILLLVITFYCFYKLKIVICVPITKAMI